MKLWIPAALVSVCGIAAAVESLKISTDPTTAAVSDGVAVQDTDPDRVHEEVQRELERARREVEAAMRAAEQARDRAVRQAEQAHEHAQRQAEQSHQQALRQAEQAMRQAEQARGNSQRQAERARERAERDYERAMVHSQRQAERGDAPQAAEDARRAYEAALGQRGPEHEADDRRAVTRLRSDLEGLSRAPRSENDAIRSLEDRVSELERRLGITPPQAPRPSAEPRGVRAPRAMSIPRPGTRAARPARPARPAKPARGARSSSRSSAAPAPSADCCSEGALMTLPSGVQVMDFSELEGQLAQLPEAISVDLSDLHEQLAELEGLELSALASSQILLDLESLEGLQDLEFSGVGVGSGPGFSFWASSACPSCGEGECSDCSDGDDCADCEEEDGCCGVEVVILEDSSCDEGSEESAFAYAYEFHSSGSDSADECDEVYESSECEEAYEASECEESSGEPSGFELDLERFNEPWGDSFPEPDATDEPGEPVSTRAPSLVGHWADGQSSLPSATSLPWRNAAAPAPNPVSTSPLMRELSEIVDEMRDEVADLRATLRSLRAEVKRSGPPDFDGQL